MHAGAARRPAYISLPLVLFLLLCGSARAQLWRPAISPSDLTNFGASFSDSLNGVIVNWGVVSPGAEIYHTGNGGASWSQAFSSSDALFAVAFADRTTGFAVGGDQSCNCGGIYKTVDQGVSWALQETVGEATPSLYAVSFVNSSTGFIGGDGGVLLKTTNGGSSWSNLNSGTNGTIRNIQFVDEHNGFVVVAEAGNSLQGVKVLKTTDGGGTWKSIDFDNYVPEAVWFTSPKVGFVVGTGGRPSVIKTTDGGETWTEKFHNLSPSDFLLSVQFVNPYVGYAVGGNPNFGQGTSGEILSTTDGGETWTAEESHYAHTIRWVTFPTETVGYAVGEDGTVLKTSRKAIVIPVPTVGVSRQSLDFGSVAVGDDKKLTLDISPANQAGLRVDSVVADSGDFTVATSKPLPAQLARGEKLTVTVTFAPAAAGAHNSTLRIVTNDSATKAKVIAITAQSPAAAQPGATISIDSLGFGTVDVQSTKQLAISVAPANSAGLVVDSIYITDAAGAVGAVSITTSPALPAILAEGDAATVTVTYAPTVEGDISGVIVIETNDAIAAATRIPFSGHGRAVAAVSGLGGDATHAIEAEIDPSPASDRATLRIRMRRAGEVAAVLVDQRGAVVLALPARMMEPGEHELPLNLAGLAAGVYQCRVTTPGASAQTRLVVVR